MEPSHIAKSSVPVLGIPGEAGDGLDQHTVDFALPAVGQQTVKVLPLVRFRAAGRLIGVNVHQLSTLVLADQLGVTADLGGID